MSKIVIANDVEVGTKLLIAGAKMLVINVEPTANDEQLELVLMNREDYRLAYLRLNAETVLYTHE